LGRATKRPQRLFRPPLQFVWHNLSSVCALAQSDMQTEGECVASCNGISSGLSLGTVVIEAGEKSGALITARRALEQNREVFAVPGSIFAPGSRGSNRLIRDSGAKLITSADDVLTELQLQLVPQQLEMRQLLPTNAVEGALLALLSPEPRHIDELTRASALPVAEVSSALSMMELKGMARQVGGMQYVIGG